MVSDQEPRYRLVDDEGNIVGSLYGKPDGSVAIQETDSGSDREVTLAPDGTFSAPSVETESVTTEKADTRSGYEDVLASRDFDVQETNDTGSDLDVSVTVVSDASDTLIALTLSVDGVFVSRPRIESADQNDRVVAQATVPAGSNYELATAGDTADYSLERWAEQS